MTTIHHPTSRPITNQCLWEWPIPGEDYVHDKSTFTRNNAIRSFYVVHPDWISEEFNRPRTNGRQNLPWPWEFPGARSMYQLPTSYYRKRVLNEMKVEDNARKVNSADPHYKVAHSSPPHINNPAEVPYSSVAEKRPIHHPWVEPWNNQRPTLKRELSLPPLDERLRNGDLAKNLHRGTNIQFGTVQREASTVPYSTRFQFGSAVSAGASPRRSFPYTYAQSQREETATAAPTKEEAETFRRLHNTYMTACSWK
ncbi:uncharacterized protein LOC141907386 [Tubulanus polymorphus]|uniref:uncharacterized protein LOC141907386 n=1 Tax=Tubulanus polymorphus TaxID=672921 RepID=UPI003DA38976